MRGIPLQESKIDLDLLLHNHKINRVSPYIIQNLNLKFESDFAKTVVCILSTKYYTHNAEVYLDLWPRHLKSIWFLLLSSTTYIRSLKVIEKKMLSVSCPQGLIHSVKNDLDLLPFAPKSIGFFLSSSITYMRSLKVIGQTYTMYPVHKIFYTESLNWPRDPWSRDPKSNGFLFSSSTIYLWSLKVNGQKL